MKPTLVWQFTGEVVDLARGRVTRLTGRSRTVRNRPDPPFYRQQCQCRRSSPSPGLAATNPGGWCRGTDSNCRHRHFQCRALPPELPRPTTSLSILPQKAVKAILPTATGLAERSSSAASPASLWALGVERMYEAAGAVPPTQSQLIMEFGPAYNMALITYDNYA